MDGFYLSPFEDTYLSKIGGNKMDKFELVRFTDHGFELDVRADLQHDTVWLTNDEMALLFDVDRTRILRHINKIYDDQELEQDSTCAESAQVPIRKPTCSKMEHL